MEENDTSRKKIEWPSWCRNDSTFKNKLLTLVRDLPNYYVNKILNLSEVNARLTVHFIESSLVYENITAGTKANKIAALCKFIRLLKDVHGKEISLLKVKRDDFIKFQDSIRRTESNDPLHKWIGTYNQYFRNLKTFYRWLNNPDKPPKDRSSPPCMEGLSQLHRKEVTTYSKNDMWTEEDDLIFLKYCEDSRIRCYHTIAKDTSGRPHELLALRLGDPVEKINEDGITYAELTIGAGGKTKERPVALYYSYPYYKEWLSHHPTPSNPEAFIFKTREKENKYKNARLQTKSLDAIYRKLKLELYPRLLDRSDIPKQDKERIKKLLLKPWNPYVRRHTGLTEKVSSPQINEFNFRLHAGWTKDSKMLQRYTHELANTSKDTLLDSWGVRTKTSSIESKLKPIICKCGESNKPDARYCVNPQCRELLTSEPSIAVIERDEQDKLRKEETEKRLERLEQLVTTLSNSGASIPLRDTAGNVQLYGPAQITPTILTDNFTPMYGTPEYKLAPLETTLENEILDLVEELNNAKSKNDTQKISRLESKINSKENQLKKVQNAQKSYQSSFKRTEYDRAG